MTTQTINYVQVEVKEPTIKALKKFFGANTPQEAMDKLADWVKERERENRLMKKYQNKGTFERT